MKKKFILLFILFIGIFTLTGCSSDAKKFKDDYESLNNVTNSRGDLYRSLNINKDNPFVYASGKDILEKIENKETFYVYFGSKLCPWCRSVVEKAIEVANDYGIDKIYYVDAWDDEGNEILRDKYALDDNGNTKLLVEGTSEYFELLEAFEDILPDYTYAANKNGGSELNIDEKRIYFPTFIYVKNGVTLKMTDGLSDLQTNSREELTLDILKQEQDKFEDFFTEFCDSSC